MIHDISAKKFKNFCKWKKIQLKIEKAGVEEKRKRKTEKNKKGKEK